MQNSGAFLERRSLGVRSVMIQDSQGLKNFTDISWGYQVITTMSLYTLIEIS